MEYVEDQLKWDENTSLHPKSGAHTGWEVYSSKGSYEKKGIFVLESEEVSRKQPATGYVLLTDGDGNPTQLFEHPQHGFAAFPTTEMKFTVSFVPHPFRRFLSFKVALLPLPLAFHSVTFRFRVPHRRGRMMGRERAI